ncbi:MAG: hypothetical protein QXN05_00805 [Acidilobaceae archaeon]
MRSRKKKLMLLTIFITLTLVSLSALALELHWKEVRVRDAEFKNGTTVIRLFDREELKITVVESYAVECRVLISDIDIERFEVVYESSEGEIKSLIAECGTRVELPRGARPINFILLPDRGIALVSQVLTVDKGRLLYTYSLLPEKGVAVAEYRLAYTKLELLVEGGRNRSFKLDVLSGEDKGVVLFRDCTSGLCRYEFSDLKAFSYELVVRAEDERIKALILAVLTLAIVGIAFLSLRGEAISSLLTIG